MNMPTRDPEPTWNPAYNQNPPMLDNALVTRSTLVCGGGKLSTDEYNMGLHVMALFVVLAQSTIACAFPLIAKNFPQLRIPSQFLFFARHFGTGVLIATAFVHLLPTAFISLTDPCLPKLWNEDFPAMAGAIAMCAVFLVCIIEMLFARGHVCGGNAQGGGEGGVEGALEAGFMRRSIRKAMRKQKKKEREANGNEEGRDDDDMEEDDSPPSSNSSVRSEAIGGRGGVGQVGFGMAGKRRSRSHSFGQGLRRVEGELQRVRSLNAAQTGSPTVPNRAPSTTQRDSIEISELRNVNNTNSTQSNMAPVQEKDELARYPTTIQDEDDENSGANTPIELTPAQKRKKALLQVALLEMGILFHSVFIGMALAVTTGSGFVVLLIAILFHQTFEGLALGSRIGALTWNEERPYKPWLMALAYGLTTPIGQALGLATHTLYAPDSQTGLLMVGIMNAISSGLLVFAALVELLAEDFLSDDSYRELKGGRRITAFSCVFLGAMCMSVVGGWA